jgi:putative transposase
VSRLIARDAEVLPPLRTLAAQYPRYGYRTIRIFLARQGHPLGTDRLYRLWRQEGLQVPKKRPRRRVATSRPRPLPPTGINHVWGVRLRVRYLRRWPSAEMSDGHRRVHAGMPGHRRGGRDSVGPRDRGTDAVRERTRCARYLRSDNGPEFVARAILRWLQTAQIETAFIDPGKPWQNGADESFNGKLRDQHLSLQWFGNRADAKVSIEARRRHYNEVRPHSSLGYLTPAQFKAKHLAGSIDRGRSPAMPARATPGRTKNH